MMRASASTDLRWHDVGDSISAYGWMQTPGGLLDLLNRAYGAFSGVTSDSGRLATGASSGRSVLGDSGRIVPPPRPQISLTVSGVAGNRVHDIAIAVPTRITAFNPQKLIVQVGVNDANLGTLPSAFLTDAQSVVDQAVAGTPALANNGIGWVNAMCIGELWQAGGSPWGANPKDAAVDAINAEIAQLAANNPGVVTVLDIRTQLGLWLQQHAPGPPGNAQGLVTWDQFHPEIILQVLMGIWSMQSISVVA